MTAHCKKECKQVCAKLSPGICGLPCLVRVCRIEKGKASVDISETECTMLHKVAENIKEIKLREVFASITVNPVYQAAEKAGCHASCPVPVAILKAAEVALDMALAMPVAIDFVDCD